MDPDKTYANLYISREVYNQFRGVCDRQEKKYGPAVEEIMKKYVAENAEGITILGRKVTLSAKCSHCGVMYRDLNVCRSGDGAPLFLCERCTQDLIQGGGGSELQSSNY